MLFEEYIKIGPFGEEDYLLSTLHLQPRQYFHTFLLSGTHFFGVKVLREEYKNIGCIGNGSIYSALDSGTELKSTAAQFRHGDAHTDRC